MRFVPTRARVGLALATGALFGCAVKEPGINPPDGDRRRFYFPSGLAVDPVQPGDPVAAGRWLYVTNANADLLYNAGTLQVVDLEKALAGAETSPDAGTDTSPDGGTCRADPVGPALENCDEADLIVDQESIGSFAGDIEIRADGSRLYFPTRSGPSGVAWVDLKPEVDGGPDPETGSGKLESLKYLVALEDLPQVDGGPDPETLPAEPFGLALVESCGFPQLYVTHLTQGVVSVLHDCRDDGLVARAISPEVLPRTVSNPQRVFAIAPRTRDVCGALVYVTSSTSEQVGVVIPDVLVVPDENPSDGGTPDAALTVSCPEQSGVRLVTGPPFSLAPPLDDQTEGTGQHGSDARGIAFSDDGARAWVAVREPPALVRVDTREEDELPRNRVEALAEVCPQPSGVRVREVAGHTLVYVVCFATHQIFVVDGDLMQLVDVIETGRGPATLEFDEGRHLAYVAHYAENTIGVIDLDPARLTFHRVLRTLGLPEPLLQ